MPIQLHEINFPKRHYGPAHEFKPTDKFHLRVNQIGEGEHTRMQYMLWNERLDRGVEISQAHYMRFLDTMQAWTLHRLQAVASEAPDPI